MPAISQDDVDFVQQININRGMVGYEPILAPELGEDALQYLARLWFSGGASHDYALDFAARFSIDMDDFNSTMQYINDTTARGSPFVLELISKIGNYTAEHPGVLLLPVAIGLGAVAAIEHAGEIFGGMASDTGDQIIQVIDSTSGPASAAIGQLSQTVQLALLADSRTSSEAVKNIGSTVLEGILRNSDVSSRVLDSNVTRVLGTIGDLIKKSSDTSDTLTDRILRAISDVTGHTYSVQESILGKIGDVLAAHLGEATESNRQVSEAIKRGLETQIDLSKKNAEQISGDVTKAIDAVLNTSTGALATARDAIVESGGEQVLATREGADQIATATGAGFEGMGQRLSQIFGGYNGDDPTQTLGAMQTAISAAMARTGCPPALNDIVQGFISEIFGHFSVYGVMAQVQLATSAFGALMGPVLEVLGNCSAQAAATLVPTSLPGVPDTRDQLARGMIDEQEAMRTLMAQGYSVERAKTLLDQRRELPEVGIIQTWVLRGFVTVERAIRLLADLGYDQESIDHLLKMIYYIPPVGDLVTMSVREAFSPEIAQRFGQYEDFPEDFAKYASLQGVNREWAQRYWASHWALPGAMQGFEMYHREIITRDDLDKLLRALDVMPFWRDRLVKMAYRPMPRVDIRRLNAVGIVSDAELPQRYRHFGFSPEDAEKMAEFTKRLNRAPASENVNELRGITRALALKLFRENVLTEDQTREALTKAKVSVGAQNILLQAEKVEAEIEERKAQTDLVIEKAKAGTLEFSEAANQLRALGLTPAELHKAETKLERARATETKLPSHSELDKLLGEKIITQGLYLQTMQLIGYSEEWAKRFLTLAEKH